MPKRRTQRVKSQTSFPVAMQWLKHRPPAVAPAAMSGEAVVSLRRGLEILRTFQSDDGLLSRHEIAQRTGLPNTTTTRLIHTLVTLGYLSRVGLHGGYRPGPSVLALGHALIEALPFRRVARPLMQRFALDFNVWVTLGTAEGDNILVLEYVASARAPDLQIRPGSLGFPSPVPLWDAHIYGPWYPNFEPMRAKPDTTGTLLKRGWTLAFGPRSANSISTASALRPADGGEKFLRSVRQSWWATAILCWRSPAAA